MRSEMVSYLSECKIYVGASRYNWSAPFVRIIYALQCDIFLVLKQAVELWPDTVEAQFGQDKGNISPDQGAISCGNGYALRCRVREESNLVSRRRLQYERRSPAMRLGCVLP